MPCLRIILLKSEGIIIASSAQSFCFFCLSTCCLSCSTPSKTQISGVHWLVHGLPGLAPSLALTCAFLLREHCISDKLKLCRCFTLRQLRSPNHCYGPWSVSKQEVPPTCLLCTPQWFISLWLSAAKLAQLPEFSAKLYWVVNMWWKISLIISRAWS